MLCIRVSGEFGPAIWFIFCPHAKKKERRGEKRTLNCYVLIYSTACIFDGAYPNDTVFCKEYVENSTCTNTKECCEIPDSHNKGCFNMSVIQGTKM